MKRAFFAMCMLLFSLPYNASAAEISNKAKEAEPVLRVVVTDKDPKGTNVRESPKGKVIHTIALEPADEMERHVDVYEQNGEWFRVKLSSGKQGWMHGSVLALRDGTTEEGACPLRKNPAKDAPVVYTPKEGAVLHLIGFNAAGWFHVRHTDAKNVKYEGWVPPQCE